MAEKLAIDGGKPVLARKDFKNWPVIGADERRLVNEVLDKGIVVESGSHDELIADVNGLYYSLSKLQFDTTTA